MFIKKKNILKRVLHYIEKIYTFCCYAMPNLGEYIGFFASGRKFKSNILSPLFAIGFLIIPTSMWGFIYSPDLFVKIFCGICIIAFFCYFIRQYEYWRKTDPDRLQSEWLYSEKLRLTFQEKGNAPKLIEDAKIVQPPTQITNGGQNG